MSTKYCLAQIKVYSHQTILTALAAIPGASLGSPKKAGKTEEVAQIELWHTAAVILGSLLRITEYLIGVSNQFEPVFRLRIWINVGMQLASQPAVSLLNLVCRCFWAHPQGFVMSTQPFPSKNLEI
jgi:hypothetical protein